MGAFVSVAQEAGFQVTGTEMAETAVHVAKKRFGVSLHLGSLETLPETEPYDTVVLWDVIEHCPRPDLVLDSVFVRLRVRGKVLLTTGNFESEDRLQSGRRWWCWAADHYHYFSPAGIQRLAQRTGLSQFRISCAPRIRSNATTKTSRSVVKKRLRHLSPFHLARAVAWNCRHFYAQYRWPHHYHIGIMFCEMARMH